MNAVLELADVTVKRGTATLLDGVDWAVEDDERWVLLGPNGAGKTTLLQVAAAQMFPTSGIVALLGELLGTVDVFELRPRIGVASAAVADRIPRDEKVRDLVVSAAYGVVAAGARSTTSSTTTGPPRCSSRSEPVPCSTAPSAPSARGSASACRSPVH